MKAWFSWVSGFIVLCLLFIGSAWLVGLWVHIAIAFWAPR